MKNVLTLANLIDLSQNVIVLLDEMWKELDSFFSFALGEPVGQKWLRKQGLNTSQTEKHVNIMIIFSYFDDKFSFFQRTNNDVYNIVDNTQKFLFFRFFVWKIPYKQDG